MSGGTYKYDLNDSQEEFLIDKLLPFLNERFNDKNYLSDKNILKQRIVIIEQIIHFRYYKENHREFLNKWCKNYIFWNKYKTKRNDRGN